MRILRSVFLLSTALTAQQLTFQRSTVPTDPASAQILTADFNSDGIPDLAQLSETSISILLGNGDGTFKAPVKIPASGYATIIAGDFNHDGKMDLVALGAQKSSGASLPIDTYLGKGDGTFTVPVRSNAPLAYGAAVAVTDVNQDGNTDIILPATILFGAGDGTFTPENRPGSNITQAAADFNGDGKIDLVQLKVSAIQVSTILFFTSSVVIVPGNGDGSFGNPSTVYDAGECFYSCPSYSVQTGDFDGDGNADLLIAGQSPAANGASTPLPDVILFGNGDGTFRKPVTWSGNLYVAPTIVTDINGDGKADIVQDGGPAPGAGAVRVVLSQTGFPEAYSYPDQAHTLSIAVADFNNDGLPDIGTASGEILINTTYRIDAITNAASSAIGQPVAPGSLVTIYGAGIGPLVPVTDRSVPLQNSLAGVSVTFNAVPAPLLFVSARQINAQVPWSIAGTATVAVSVNGSQTPPMTISTAPIAPAVFASAMGQAIAFHQDGSLADSNHPASAGEILTVYATGLGPVSPPIGDGVISNDMIRRNAPTPVFIGGIQATVLFAGLSPNFVGVNQLNVIVPTGVSGIVPLQINAGGFITTAKVTIAAH